MTETATPGGGKGRPTPKRRDAEVRRGPVAPPPATRKEAAQRKRAAAVAERKSQNGGRRVAKFDPEVMLKRDRGPARGRVRDLVDSRRNIGVLLLPFALAVVIAQLTGDSTVQDGVLSVYPIVLLLVLLDSGLLTRRIIAGVKAAVPEPGKMGGHIAYGLLRSTVIRRFRMPPPVVSAPSFRRRKT